MTIPIVPKAEFPSVPKVSGMPPVPRSSAVPAPTTTFSGRDGANVPVNTVDKVWGVFDQNNKRAFDVDTYMMVKPTNDVKVSSFPVEDGGFVSFNKVQNPNIIKVKVSKGGDTAAMSDLLSTLKDMLASVDLFNLVTPYETFLNVSLEKYDYTQEGRKGANRIDAELSFIEVRQVSARFSNVALPASKVKNPASASTQDDGKQQTKRTSVLTSSVNSVSNWLKR